MHTSVQGLAHRDGNALQKKKKKEKKKISNRDREAWSV